jgi:hypothetical protein
VRVRKSPQTPQQANTLTANRLTSFAHDLPVLPNPLSCRAIVPDIHIEAGIDDIGCIDTVGHSQSSERPAEWMAGTRPAMTVEVRINFRSARLSAGR